MSVLFVLTPRQSEAATRHLFWDINGKRNTSIFLRKNCALRLVPQTRDRLDPCFGRWPPTWSILQHSGAYVHAVVFDFVGLG